MALLTRRKALDEYWHNSTRLVGEATSPFLGRCRARDTGVQVQGELENQAATKMELRRLLARDLGRVS